MTYKWTIPEMDLIEMPMIFCLLEQIGETPPADLIMIGQMKAAQERAEREKQGALSGFERQKGKVRRRNDGD